ncbi:MAG: hypothetical protein KC496_18325 [Anaerolineae bacterium]|nr:hypothetical protein [Anaerolineae bacterium]
MARARSDAWLVALVTTIITVFFFIEMMLYGVGLGVGLAAAGLMGLFTAALATASYRYRGYLQRKAFTGKKQADESLSSRQERSIEIDLPVDAAFDLALDALQTLHRQDVPQPEDDSLLMRLENWVPRKQFLRIHKQNRAAGIIHAGLRSKVFGLDNVADFSRIDLQLEEVDSVTTRIVISSKPAMLSEYYDLGKNLHYVNSLAKYIRFHSHQINAEERLSLSDAETDEAFIAADHQQREDYK